MCCRTAVVEKVPETFNADRPFFFAYLDKTSRLVIFMGYLNKINFNFEKPKKRGMKWKFYVFLISPTAILCETDSIQKTIEFNADHPFIFHLLSDDLEVSFFTGRLAT